MKTMLALVATIMSVASANAACPTGDSQTGTVKGTVVGITYASHCTYLMIGTDFTTTISGHDDAMFVAGRFKYIALDPTVPEEYKPMLSIALTAVATQTRVFAQVVGNYAKITTLSLSNSENSGP